jgi:hypothetical protein
MIFISMIVGHGTHFIENCQTPDKLWIHEERNNTFQQSSSVQSVLQKVILSIKQIPEYPQKFFQIQWDMNKKNHYSSKE